MRVSVCFYFESGSSHCSLDNIVNFFINKKAAQTLPERGFIFILQIKLAGLAGFEPTNDGVKVHCLTTWRQPNIYDIVFDIEKKIKWGG